MRETINILNKVLVREYYRLNAAFFLLIIVITFGLLSCREHLSLAEFFTSSIETLAFPVVLWILYLFKVVVFNQKCLAKHENQILYDISFLNKSSQLLLLAWALAAQLLPIILYGFFLAFIAGQHYQWGVFTSLVITLALILLVGTLWIYRRVSNTMHAKDLSLIKRSIDKMFYKPLVQMYIEWLIRTESQLLIGTKIFSCFLLIGVTAFYSVEPLDWRLLAMGITVAWSSNLMLIFHIHEFEQFHFTLLKNLPISRIKRLSVFCMIFTCLTLPEIGVMIRNFPEDISFFSGIELLVFGLSIGILSYASLFLKNTRTEKFNRIVFYFIIISVIAILFSIPLWILIGVNALTGIFIFFKNYYRYEPASSASA